MFTVYSEPKPADKGIDVDEAMDKMAIQNNNPDQYFEQLKKSMQEKDVKVNTIVFILMLKCYKLNLYFIIWSSFSKSGQRVLASKSESFNH